MKKIGFALIMLMIITAGCSSNTSSSSSSSKQETYTQAPKEGIIKQNKTIPIKYVQHIEKNEYEIGYVYPNTKQLVWFNTATDLTIGGIFSAPYDFHAVVEDNSKQSYLERKSDKNDKAVFVLHISGNTSIDGGVITRTCGKSCTKSIPTNVISQ